MLKLSYHGDTIVEVLIALAILSLAFAISYSTANRALMLSQNTQEHSTALAMLDSQMEMIHYESQPQNRNNPVQSLIYKSQYFCLTTSTNGVNVVVNFTLIPNIPKSLSSNGLPSIPQCKFNSGDGFNYTIIDYRNNHIFTAYIWWQGLSNLGIQHEQLAYKIYQNE